MKKVFEDDKMIEIIIRVVSAYYEIKPKDIFAECRVYRIKTARQVIHYLVRKYTKKGLDEIGKISLEYGRKKAHKHCSVLHSINSVSDHVKVDKQYAREIHEIEIKIKETTHTLTLEDLEIIEFNDMQMHYELRLNEKDAQIIELTNRLEYIDRNIGANTNNPYLKQLLKLDESVINLFVETRLKPWLRMQESKVTNQDLINKQYMLRSI